MTTLDYYSTQQQNHNLNQYDDLFFYMTPEKVNPIEIDVRPKQKYFGTPEDKQKYVENYKKKIKTELCKNFMLTGYCKFENQCSFAHGEHQLAEKSHLHEKFKTRPCSNYFNYGYCNYGIRCQYLHEEIKEKQECWPFYTKYCRNQKKFPLNLQKLKKTERIDIQRFQELKKQFKLEKTDLWVNIFNPRLPSLRSKFSEKQNKEQSTDTSRKSSNEDLLE